LKKITTLALVTLLLSGCASEPEGPKDYAALAVGLAAGCESYSTGAGADLVSSEGAIGEFPEVSFPYPISGEGVETKVLIAGDGGPILGTQRVALHYAGYNAATGEMFQASSFTGDDYVFQDLLAGNTPDFCKALTGVNVGSRVAVLLDPASAHQGAGIASLGIGPDQGVLFVFDVVDAYLPRANGDAKSAEAGMPTVILAPQGQPGVQIPATDAPTEFNRTVLIEGGGEEIAIGESVVVHYTGWTWEGDQFDSSWDRQAPSVFTVSSDSLIEGFVQALEGVTVGSQVIAVIPPELGYGDRAQGSIPAGSTLIFVVDVLGKD
jgi:FKBP-type peptidyl-prolyl cis-trans isomerase